MMLLAMDMEHNTVSAENLGPYGRLSDASSLGIRVPCKRKYPYADSLGPLPFHNSFPSITRGNVSRRSVGMNRYSTTVLMHPTREEDLYTSREELGFINHVNYYLPDHASSWATQRNTVPSTRLHFHNPFPSITGDYVQARHLTAPLMHLMRGEDPYASRGGFIDGVNYYLPDYTTQMPFTSSWESQRNVRRRRTISGIQPEWQESPYCDLPIQSGLRRLSQTWIPRREVSIELPIDSVPSTSASAFCNRDPNRFSAFNHRSSSARARRNVYQALLWSRNGYLPFSPSMYEGSRSTNPSAEASIGNSSRVPDDVLPSQSSLSMSRRNFRQRRRALASAVNHLHVSTRNSRSSMNPISGTRRPWIHHLSYTQDFVLHGGQSLVSAGSSLNHPVSGGVPSSDLQTPRIYHPVSFSRPPFVAPPTHNDATFVPSSQSNPGSTFQRPGRNQRHHFLNEDMPILNQSFMYGGINVEDRHRHMRLDVDNMSYEELLRLDERVSSNTSGLADEAMASCIKTSKYISNKDEPAEDQEVKCCICQENYVNGDEMGTLKCNHGYHTTCIKKWLALKNQCPICKAAACPEV